MAVADRRNRITFNVSDGFDEFREVSKALTKIDRQLPRDFKNSINEVARGLRDAARVAALAIPAKGDEGTTGMRKRVSKGVGMISMPTGVEITTSMPSMSEVPIPLGLDTARGWRHPVFGNRKKWVQQHQGTNNWFMEIMWKGQEPIRNRIVRNINDAADTVKNAGR